MWPQASVADSEGMSRRLLQNSRAVFASIVFAVTDPSGFPVYAGTVAVPAGTRVRNRFAGTGGPS